jgi:prevent-host-death family protein
LYNILVSAEFWEESMAERESGSELTGSLVPSELNRVFEVIPLSEARANLSQVIERVAYSGNPVIISKHDRSRVAVVPLDLLVRDRARFVAAATKALRGKARRDYPAQDDVAFEDIEGLSEQELTAVRADIDASARRDDHVSEETVLEIINSPVFVRGVERVVTKMALGIQESEASSG